ncbi:CsbD family protein [Streptomyces sp. NPDC058964]|uniref:CsbD family protein n=1 Tax=Streptomyces sp. NPDC058964 TaxID=3346681 RepID=UPI0036CED179
MTAGEKARAKIEQVKGASKQALGRSLGNDRLAAEGQTERNTGGAREAREKAKDAFKH